MRKTVTAVILGILLMMAATAGQAETNSSIEMTNTTATFSAELSIFKKQQCTQVLTAGINPETGQIAWFPTHCDIPEGWQTAVCLSQE